MRVTTEDLSIYKPSTRLQRARCARGILSTRELSEMTGINVDWIRNFEGGSRKTLTEADAKKIADALQVDVLELFGSECIRSGK